MTFTKRVFCSLLIGIPASITSCAAVSCTTIEKVVKMSADEFEAEDFGFKNETAISAKNKITKKWILNNKVKLFQDSNNICEDDIKLDWTYWNKKTNSLIIKLTINKKQNVFMIKNFLNNSITVVRSNEIDFKNLHLPHLTNLDELNDDLIYKYRYFLFYNCERIDFSNIKVTHKEIIGSDKTDVKVSFTINNEEFNFVFLNALQKPISLKQKIFRPKDLRLYYYDSLDALDYVDELFIWRNISIIFNQSHLIEWKDIKIKNKLLKEMKDRALDILELNLLVKNKEYKIQITDLSIPIKVSQNYFTAQELGINKDIYHFLADNEALLNDFHFMNLVLENPHRLDTSKMHLIGNEFEISEDQQTLGIWCDISKKFSKIGHINYFQIKFPPSEIPETSFIKASKLNLEKMINLQAIKFIEDAWPNGWLFENKDKIITNHEEIKNVDDVNVKDIIPFNNDRLIISYQVRNKNNVFDDNIVIIKDFSDTIDFTFNK